MSGYVKCKDEVWIMNNNAKLRKERLALRETRYGRLRERDRQWEAAMRGNGCAVERVTLLDDGKIIRRRGHLCGAWGSFA